MTTPLDARLRDGIAAARAKRLDLARTLLQQAVDAAPDDPLAWFWLAVVSPTSETAVSHLRRVLAIDPSHVPAREALAKLLLAQLERMLDAAQRVFRDAAAVAPEMARARWHQLTTLDIDPAVETPLPSSLDAIPPQPCIEQDAADCRPASAKRTVMVVDDSPTIRKILSLTLEDAGYSVVSEIDGESALGRLSDLVPDVVLLDIAMPGIDGYETCKRIKADSRTAHLPVLMLSGKDALFDKVKGHMAGASEYLTKPFEAATVLAAVAGACSGLPAEAVAKAGGIDT